MVAVITITQILELLGIFIVMNVVLLAPLILVVAGIWREYVQNQESRRGSG
jgi:hypothetical protein